MPCCLLASFVLVAACGAPTPTAGVRAAEAPPPPAWYERSIRADAIGAEHALLDPMLDEILAETGAPRGDGPAVAANASLSHDLIVIADDAYRRDGQLELIIADEDGAPMTRRVWNLQATGEHPQATLASLHEAAYEQLHAFFAEAYGAEQAE